MVFLEDPPPRSAHPTPTGWAALAVQVRARGGRWCNISEEVDELAPSAERGHAEAFYTSLAAALAAGRIPGFGPAGAFEARAEGPAVWARSTTPQGAPS